jgi:hypothetical protein
MDTAALSREVNLRIHEISAGLADPDVVIDYLCECGCMRQVPLTIAQFEAHGGAWNPGHMRYAQEPTRVA